MLPLVCLVLHFDFGSHVSAWSQIWLRSVLVFPGYMQIRVVPTPVQRVVVMHQNILDWNLFLKMLDGITFLYITFIQQDTYP